MEIESPPRPAGDVEATARRPAASRHRSGGPVGNERLTGATAAVLLVLLAVEGVTIVFLRPLLSVHIFVGMLLIPPVALKLASTGYRFARYYSGSIVYRLKGPPARLLRLLGPLVVAATIVLFASGVALLVAGPSSRFVLGLHKASFVVWFVVMTVHVLAHVLRVARLAPADWRRSEMVEGSWIRRVLLATALVTGVALAAATLPLADSWLAQVR